MTEDVLLIEKSGAVATVTLNRPDKLNAFNADLRAAMRDTVARLEDDNAIRVVILTGAGRGFSAGADLSAGPTSPTALHLDIEYKPFLTGIAQSNKIWIAAVHGPCAGIGAAVAQTCDLMVMAEDSYIYMAFAAIALVPDGGNTQLLLNAMGYKRALQAVLEGRKIPAAECLEHGIANKLSAPDAVLSDAQAWADRLAEGAPMATAAAKRLLRSVGDMSFGDAISAEGIEQTPLLKSQDCITGVQAFFTKTKPVFEGK